MSTHVIKIRQVDNVVKVRISSLGIVYGGNPGRTRITAVDGTLTYSTDDKFIANSTIIFINRLYCYKGHHYNEGNDRQSIVFTSEADIDGGETIEVHYSKDNNS